MVGMTRVWQSEESQITNTQGGLMEYARRRGSVEKMFDVTIFFNQLINIYIS